MPLPAALISTYAQYKHDTDAVASWLATTAKANGYPKPFSDDEKTPAGSARSKGKARKAPKAKKAPSTFKKYIIAIKDFVPLAEFIVGKTPPISIPASFNTTIDRVIAARGGFANDLAGQEKHIKDDASDRRHGYFVDVLKQVRQLLKPDVEPTMPETPSAGSDASSDPLSNRFAGLKIYEPSDKFLETPPAAPTQDKNVVYEAETSTTLYDALFAYTLLFNDLQVIRSHIEVIWKDYRDRALDLVAASIATDTAIDLAREVIEAAMPALEGGPQEWEGGLMGLVEKFFLYHVILRGHDPETTKTSNPKDNMNHAIFYDMEDEMYITAFRLLDGLNDVLDPDHMPLIGDHALPPYRPADRSRGGQFKMMQDQHLLMGVFTDLVVCNRSVKWIANDAFLREIKEMDKTGKVSFSLVFTAQIFLDIHHILGAEADRGLQDLIRHGVFIRREIDQHLSFHENLRIDGWPKSNDQGLRQCSKLISWVLDDPVGKTKNKYYNKYGQEPPAALRSFGLLRRCPVIAGIWLAKFRTEYNEIGIAVANAWGSIGAAAHLYNACQSERLLEQGPAWPDLDVTMTILGEDSFFVGGKRPRGVADCFKKACMQLGTSTSLVAGRQRRPNASTHSAAGPRGIKAQMGRVYRVFVERYSRCEASPLAYLSPFDHS